MAPHGAASSSFRTVTAADDPALPPPLTFLLPEVLLWPVPPPPPLPPTTTENLEPAGWPEALPPSVPAARGFRRLGEAWRLVKRKDPSEPCKCGEEVWSVKGVGAISNKSAEEMQAGERG